MTEREREEAHERERKGELFQGTPSIHVFLTLLQGGPLYRREREDLTPHQGIGRQPRGGQGATRAR
jgi:hypothetical protein